MNDDSDDDFYEDDEPIEHVRARRRRPFDFVTAPPPARAITVNLYVGSGAHWTTSRSDARDEPACR